MRIQVSRMRARRLASVAMLVLAAASCSREPPRPNIDVGANTAAISVPQHEPFEQPAPIEVAYPRFDEPRAPLNVMPASETACRRELKRLGVAFRDLPAIHQGASCGIDWPVEVSSIGSVRMQPAATLTCAMAATVARWTKKELVPAARWRYFSGVRTLHQGSSYSCRNIRGTAKRSQHSVGNALDIMRIELNNGRDIDVRKPGWFAFRQRGFLKTVRQDGCDYFSTVLGPGYDADHANHFHFDIMPRKDGYVACR